MIHSFSSFSSLKWLAAGLMVLALTACQPEEPPEDETAEATPVTAEPAEETTDERVEEEYVDEDECLLTMGWDPWEPYHSMGSGGAVEGLDIDIVSALADEVGCDLEFIQDNWASHLRAIQRGEMDLLGGATRTPERERFAHFSDPYRSEQFVLFIREGSLDEYPEEGLESLLENGFRLGLTQGFVYSEEVTTLQTDERFENQFVEAPISELHFNRLQDDRIDGFLDDPYAVAAIERRRGLTGETEPHPIEFPSGEVHFMFSRETVSEEQVEAFNQALEIIREDGRYEEILDRYGS